MDKKSKKMLMVASVQRKDMLDSFVEYDTVYFVCVLIVLATIGLSITNNWNVIAPMDSPHHQDYLIVKFYNNESVAALVYWEIEYNYVGGEKILSAGMGNAMGGQSVYGGLYFNVTDNANETICIKAWVGWYESNISTGVIEPSHRAPVIDTEVDLKDYSELYKAGSEMKRWAQIPFVLEKAT